MYIANKLQNKVANLEALRHLISLPKTNEASKLIANLALVTGL